MNSHRRPPMSRRLQRGLSLIGLMAWALLVGFSGYLLVRVVPTVTEYMTIQRAVAKIAESSPSTVAQARAAFDRQREIDYTVTSVAGKDLEVTKEGERVVISFAYDKVIPVFGPVYLLIRYQGRSD